MYCHRSSINGLTHAGCTHRFGLDSLTAMSHYRGLTKKAIKTLKYRAVPEIAQILGSKLADFSKDKIGSIDMVSFVPLAKGRSRKRGFNQSELIAKYLSEQFSIICVTTLVKTKETTPQADLDVEARKSNLKDVFKVSAYVKGKRILLIDDVSTTGTTLIECARVLKKSGASKVYGLVPARGH